MVVYVVQFVLADHGLDCRRGHHDFHRQLKAAPDPRKKDLCKYRIQAHGELRADLLLLVTRKHVHDARNGLRAGIGMERGETEVAGFGDGQRGLDRFAIRVGAGETRDRAIYELDTAYTYYSHIWGKNPVTGLNWTWAAVCSLQAGALTAKKGQLTEATYYIDHIQVVVTYGNGNSPPAASAVSIGGTPTVGQTLSGSYVYADREADPEGASLYQWYRAESANPNDTLKAAIKNSAVKNYVLLASEEAKYVSFEVTPVATTGVLVGLPVESDMAGPVAAKAGAAPVVSKVVITGTPAAGRTLIGSYAYSDSDNDLEGVSTFRWLRDGVAVANATDTVFKLNQSDAGAMITFEVTPVALTGLPKIGTPVVSAGVGPVGGITGTVRVPGFAKQNCVLKMTLVDMAGRSVTSAGLAQLSKGNYILVSKSGLKTKYTKVAITK